jgi:hypothetical protein
MGETTMLPSSTVIDHNWHVWHVIVQIISPAALSNGEDKTNMQEECHGIANEGAI